MSNDVRQQQQLSNGVRHGVRPYFFDHSYFVFIHVFDWSVCFSILIGGLVQFSSVSQDKRSRGAVDHAVALLSRGKGRKFKASGVSLERFQEAFTNPSGAGLVEDADAIAEFKARMKEDVNALFGDDQTISEDFKSKAATIFEARVIDRVTQIQEDMESQYAGMLEEAVETIKSDLTEKVDDYLNYVVEQWMEENQIAIESGLRSEITEDFIAGLRNLFAENYINVPEESVDLVEELAAKVEELETKLNEEIETNIVYKKALTEAIKEQLTLEVCDGLTATQVEKIKSLAESVDFSTEEEFVEKLETLRENYFPSGIQKASVSHLHEQFEDTEEKKSVSADPFISAVSQAISKTKI